MATKQPAGRRARLQAHRCLFCRRCDGPFTSREHIFPESLGNVGPRAKVLPRGVVCDECNNGILSTLDEALGSFPPIALLRVVHDVRNKRRKLAKVVFENAALSRQSDDVVQINALDRDAFAVGPRGPDGIQWTMNVRSAGPARPQDFSLLRRSMLKMALEFAWLDYPAVALAREFDHVRDIVLRGGAGYLALQRKNGRPTAEMSVVYRFPRAADGQPYLAIEAYLANGH